MFLRTVIGLFLALVFQLAQIQPCLAAACTPPSAEKKCGCCDSHDACPCASNKTDHERSTPLAPPAPELKVQLALPAPDPVAPVLAAVLSAPPLSGADTIRDPAAGYAGVPLPVAFCCFLI